MLSVERDQLCVTEQLVFMLLGYVHNMPACVCVCVCVCTYVYVCVY